MTCILIVIVFIIIVAACSKEEKKVKKPDTKASNFSELLNKLGNISYQAQDLSRIENAFYNWDKNALLDYFSYQNGILTIRMKNGNILSGPIQQFSVQFDASSYDIEKYQACVEYNGNQATIDSGLLKNLFAEQEWSDIFTYLTYCGTTYDTYVFSQAALEERRKAKKIKNVKDGIKLGSKILQMLSKM